MTYDTMDAHELRAELDDATQAALARLHDLSNAVDSRDLLYAGLVNVAAKAALARVRHVENLIRSGAAA